MADNNRQLTVKRAKLFGSITKQDISARFIESCKEMLANQHGQPSIPTIQSLMLMYLTISNSGRDRVARMYRFAAIRMLKRLNFEKRYHTLTDDTHQEIQEKRLISRFLWGVFLVETRIASSYFEPSSLSPPTIPIDDETHNIHSDAPEGTTNPSQTSFQPQDDNFSVTGMLHKMCELSVFCYEIMQYLVSNSTVQSSDDDIRTRRHFYLRLQRFRHQLSEQFLFQHNPVPTTCFLQMHENEITYVLIQNLPLDTSFDNPFNTKGITVKDLLLRTCQSDIEMADIFLQKWHPDAIVTRQLYLAMQPLVLLLHDPVSHELFTRACSLARVTAHHPPVGVCFIHAIQAFAWASKQTIPAAAQVHLQDFDRETVQQDPPVSYALPQYGWLKKICILEECEDDPEPQLGALMQKWARSKA